MTRSPLLALAGRLMPVMRSIDPETAHGLALRGLAMMPACVDPASWPILGVEAFGRRWANPLGLAAGFDKSAEAPTAALGIGFGFVELGTVTPRPQAGNPRPRLFRLTADRGVVNRFGFNNDGHAAVVARLGRIGRRPGPIGINIGANKDTADRTADYVAGVEAFAGLADFLTVNVSSPNTPGLRDLQAEAALDELLARVVAARDAMTERHGRRPLFVKIAPDLTLPELDGIVAACRRRAIDALIVSNTTVSRPASLIDPQGREAGGLSGQPLYPLATRMLAATYLRVEGQFPLVGVGGIDSAEKAITKIEAGATLLQLYSALVYQGPGLVAEILDGMAAAVKREGAPSLSSLVGRRAAALAEDGP